MIVISKRVIKVSRVRDGSYFVLSLRILSLLQTARHLSSASDSSSPKCDSSPVTYRVRSRCSKTFYSIVYDYSLIHDVPLTCHSLIFARQK